MIWRSWTCEGKTDVAVIRCVGLKILWDLYVENGVGLGLNDWVCFGNCCPAGTLVCSGGGLMSEVTLRKWLGCLG